MYEQNTYSITLHKNLNIDDPYDSEPTTKQGPQGVGFNDLVTLPLTSYKFSNGSYRFLGWSETPTYDPDNVTYPAYVNGHNIDPQVTRLSATNGGQVHLYACWSMMASCIE